MTSSNFKLSIEIATLNHKEEVEKMSENIYVGFDYIMPQYEKYVEVGLKRPDLR